MNKLIKQITYLISIVILCSCAAQQSYVKPSKEVSQDVAELDEFIDYSQFTAKMRLQWIKKRLNDHLFAMQDDQALLKKRLNVFTFNHEKDSKENDAESLLCDQRLMEIRASAGKAYLKNVTYAISQHVEEPAQDMGKLLSSLVKDSSINIAYEVSSNPTETCKTDLKEFYRTAYVTSLTPESITTAIEAGAVLYGLLKEVVIALGQEGVRTKNAVELHKFLSNQENQSNINEAIKSSENIIMTSSKIDRRYAVNRFRRAYVAMNEALRNINPLQLAECKSFFSMDSIGADHPDFQSCADSVYAKVEDKVIETVAEANKYDIEADKDPTALINKLKLHFGNLKTLADGNWKTSTYIDLVATVVRVGRLANSINKKLKSDEAKAAITNLAKELK